MLHHHIITVPVEPQRKDALPGVHQTSTATGAKWIHQHAQSQERMLLCQLTAESKESCWFSEEHQISNLKINILNENLNS